MMSRRNDSREHDTSDGLRTVFLFFLMVISLIFVYGQHYLVLPVVAGCFFFTHHIGLTWLGVKFRYEGLSNFSFRKLPAFLRISRCPVSLFSQFMIECHENMHTGWNSV